MPGDGEPRNLLARETSPYLLQHQDNPVDWMPWGAPAFARARAENKPVLLSIGYAACHWCHVMAHESFEDPDTAALMNALFVNIKVDREERPDLDQLYQAALAMLGQHGGWPLTMFLTPEGAPFWGGTYFPPADRYGRPGFPDVLREIARAYAEEPDKVGTNVEALRANLQKLAANRAGQGLSLDVLDMVAERLLQEADPVHGGIGTAPKFPQCSLLQLFWRAWHRTSDGRYRDAVLTALTHMCQGGLYDHLGGGFARYATDDRWLVPHFEKMLYDNAQLLEVLTLAWQVTGDPLFEARVRETVDWVLREMRAAPDDAGRRAFASTLDADSEGEEGRFYVWTEDAIDQLLSEPGRALFKQTYGVSSAGNWEGKTILNRLGTLALGSEQVESVLAEQRATLWAAREQRVRPAWDDKVLTDWNGLMIAALARAARVFRATDWLSAAEDAYAFVTRIMRRSEERLWHSWRAGQGRQDALLEDYAAMARAALTLFEVTGTPSYRDDAIRWFRLLDQHYWDDVHGGYFMTPGDGEPLLVRPKSVYDNAVPSGNGLALEGLARLAYLTGESRWRTRADALVTAFTGEVSRNIFPLATFLNAFELLETPIQVVVVGRRGEAATEALLDAVFETPCPTALVQVVEPGTTLPSSHPAHGKTAAAPDVATAFVCFGPVCSAPVTDPNTLHDLLESRGA